MAFSYSDPYARTYTQRNQKESERNFFMSVFILACVIIIDHTKKGLRTNMTLSMR